MPSRKTTRAAKANASRMPSIPRELLDQIERAVSGELSRHLGYSRGQDKPKGATNHRNGKSAVSIRPTPP